MSMTLTSAVAKKYMSAMFIETGTAKGDGIQLALDAGYPSILSVDSDLDLFQKASERFRNTANVTVAFGNSPDVLRQMLPNVKCHCTFWLDAHSITGSENPLLDELDVIAEQGIRTHNILIDDRRVMLSQWKITEHDIMSRLLRINARYQIRFEDSSIAEQDIIAARVLGGIDG